MRRRVKDHPINTMNDLEGIILVALVRDRR